MGKGWAGESPGRYKKFSGSGTHGCLDDMVVQCSVERQGRSCLKIGTVNASERTPPLVFFSPVASKMVTPSFLQSTATVATSRIDRSYIREVKPNVHPALHLQAATLPIVQKSTAFHSLLSLVKAPCPSTKKSSSLTTHATPHGIREAGCKSQSMQRRRQRPPTQS